MSIVQPTLKEGQDRNQEELKEIFCLNYFKPE